MILAINLPQRIYIHWQKVLTGLYIIYIKRNLLIIHWFQKLYDHLKLANVFILWLRTSYMSSSIYMERNKSFWYTYYFWITKATHFQKTIIIIIVLNTYHLLLFTTHKNILSFTKFYGKRKYYRELISYEQCRFVRIISKGGWTVVSWG